MKRKGSTCFTPGIYNILVDSEVPATMAHCVVRAPGRPPDYGKWRRELALLGECVRSFGVCLCILAESPRASDSERAASAMRMFCAFYWNGKRDHGLWCFGPRTTHIASPSRELPMTIGTITMLIHRCVLGNLRHPFELITGNFV